jgi:signal transduction histidine kinase
LASASLTYVLFQNRLRLEYLVFPLIMLSRPGASGCVVKAPAALIASGSRWSAVQERVPLGGDAAVKMVTLQVFNVFVALASFVLAAFIEARKRAEEMTRLYVSATAASQTKSSFLNMAAHELLTPLTVFTGYLSLLSGGSLGKPPQAWDTPINILMSKTREMERIISDLQNASRLEVVDPHLVGPRPSICERSSRKEWSGLALAPSFFMPRSWSTFRPIPFGWRSTRTTSLASSTTSSTTRSRTRSGRPGS